MNVLKPYLWLATLLTLAVLSTGCGPFNPLYQRNNQVRLAVYAYERQERGKSDDLVIYFYRTEPRVKFEGQMDNDGRTVWLFDLAAREYFELLPPGRSYMVIQQIEYDSQQTRATVDVYRGDTTGYRGRTLTLAHAADEGWQVVDDAVITAAP